MNTKEDNSLQYQELRNDDYQAKRINWLIFSETLAISLRFLSYIYIDFFRLGTLLIAASYLLTALIAFSILSDRPFSTSAISNSCSIYKKENKKNNF